MAGRRFELHRSEDVSGVSGTGVVADGIAWPDGTASVRWRGAHASAVFWDRGWESVEHVHGHGGLTRIVLLDPPLGASDAEHAEGRTRVGHYFSTHCLHDAHTQCKGTCKHCEAPCRCGCHRDGQP